jgi:hypothetical protein
MDNSEINASSSLPIPGYDALTPVLNFLFGADGLVQGFGLGGIFSVLGYIFLTAVVIGIIASVVMLILYVYASIEIEKLEEYEEEHVKAGEEAWLMQTGVIAKSDRFAELQEHLDSENPNDWKLAIIEADIILDEVLKRQGYAGTSLGERLKSISPSVLASLDDAWQAHKVRNQIAHAGAEFVLTHKIARETITQYQRVFKELGIH